MKAVEKESGQGLVEYALILVLVAVAVIAILTILGDNVVLGYARVIGGLSGQNFDNGAILLSSDETASSSSGSVCSVTLTNLSFIAVDGSGALIKDGAVSATITGGIGSSSVGGTASGSGIVEYSGSVTLNGPCPLTPQMAN